MGRKTLRKNQLKRKNTIRKSFKRKTLKRKNLKRKTFKRKNLKRKTLKKGGKPIGTEIGNLIRKGREWARPTCLNHINLQKKSELLLHNEDAMSYIEDFDDDFSNNRNRTEYTLVIKINISGNLNIYKYKGTNSDIKILFKNFCDRINMQNISHAPSANDDGYWIGHERVGKRWVDLGNRPRKNIKDKMNVVISQMSFRINSNEKCERRVEAIKEGINLIQQFIQNTEETQNESYRQDKSQLVALLLNVGFYQVVDNS